MKRVSCSQAHPFLNHLGCMMKSLPADHQPPDAASTKSLKVPSSIFACSIVICWVRTFKAIALENFATAQSGVNSAFTLLLASQFQIVRIAGALASLVSSATSTLV